MEQPSLQRQPGRPGTAPGKNRIKHIFRALAEPIRNLRKEAADIRNEEESLPKTRTAAESPGTPDSSASARLIERKWAASLAVSEVVGTFIGAPVVGALAQYSTHNANAGILGTVVGDYFPAVASFAIMWHSLSRGFYSKFGGFLSQVKELAADVSRFMAVGLLAAIPAYAASASLSGLYVAGAELISKKFAHGFPVPIIAETLNYFVAEAIFLYGAIKLRHWPLRKFQERYESSLDSLQPAEKD